MINLAMQRPLEEYIIYHERLSQRSVPLLDKVVAPDIRFINPFNDVHGSDAMKRIYSRLFTENENSKICISDAAWGRDGVTAYLRWTHMGMSKGSKKQWRIDGVSEVVFGADGKAVSHIDYWDSGSQLIARLPLTAWLWKIIRAKKAA